MSATIFDLQEVEYSYQKIPALRGVTLSVSRGQRIAILGANGSGKSTLLRLLNALYFPSKGTLAFCGEPLTMQRLQDETFTFDFRRRVGLVFQNPDVQLFNPTVFDELAFGPLQLHWPTGQIRERIAEILHAMDLTHLKDRAPHRLSGGEKKRVALASVLILEPEVLLLDEPTTALDPRSRNQIVDFLAEASPQRTVLTATHDLDIVNDIADHCLVFAEGELVATGSPGEILNDEDLLQRTHLLHAHRHASGLRHAHPPHSHPHFYASHHHEHKAID